jgi:hypothetical protein
MSSSTSPLQVMYASCSSSKIITFLFAPPFSRSLFLGGITVVKNVEPGAAAIAGKLRPGSSSSSGGTGELQANEDEYLHLRNYIPLAGKFTIELRYDANNFVTEIICATTAAVV